MSASRILIWIVQYGYDQILNCKWLCSINKHKTLEFLLLPRNSHCFRKSKKPVLHLSAFTNFLWSYFCREKHKLVCQLSTILLQMLYVQFCMWHQISLHVKSYPNYIVATNRNKAERDEKEIPAIIIWYTWKVNWNKYDKHGST